MKGSARSRRRPISMSCASGSTTSSVASDPRLPADAGMPAEVYIQTTERTFFEYLMQPLRDSMAPRLPRDLISPVRFLCLRKGVRSEKPAGASAPASLSMKSDAGSTHRNVEAEPLLRQRLDRAVGLGCGDRLVEHRLQLRCRSCAGRPSCPCRESRPGSAGQSSSCPHCPAWRPRSSDRPSRP